MSRPYIGIVDGREGAYGIYFPDLPGCTAIGTSMTILQDNATSAVLAWISSAQAENKTVPQASLLDELEANEAVASQIKEGAAVLPIYTAHACAREQIAMHYQYDWFWNAVFNIVKDPARYNAIVLETQPPITFVDGELAYGKTIVSDETKAIFTEAWIAVEAKLKAFIENP